MTVDNLNNQKGTHKGVLSIILGRSSEAGTVREVEQVLGIDDKFPGALNLTQRLQKILQPMCSHNKKATQWHSALAAVAAAGLSREHDLLWVPLAPTGHAGNPLGGRLKKYPLPAFFLQSPIASLEDQVQLIHQLFLAVLLRRLSNRGLRNLADDLRKTIAQSEVKNFHNLYCDPECAVFRKELDDLPENDPLAIQLRTLVKMHESSAPTKINPEPADRVSTKGTWITPGSAVPSHGIERVEPGDRKTAEPPTYVDIYISRPDEADEPDSEAEISAQSRETRYWISRHQRITPNDPGRLTLMERHWLSDMLSRFIKTEDEKYGLGAGLVALMYVTGMQLDSLLQAAVGPTGILDVMGVYRRQLRRPAGCYTPDTGLEDIFVLRSTELVLELPRTVSQWVGRFMHQPGSSVLESLGVSPDRATQSVSEVLQQLRDRGRFLRIRKERIPAALAIELSLRYRDPSVTWHLSSSPEQVAPMLDYYVVHSIDELQRCYREVTATMLPTL